MEKLTGIQKSVNGFGEKLRKIVVERRRRREELTELNRKKGVGVLTDSKERDLLGQNSEVYLLSIK